MAAPQSTADSAVSGWRVFTSVPGGYQLRYPPGWRVKESSGSGGPVLSLLPARGIGISVLVIGFWKNGLKFFTLFVPKGVPIAAAHFIVLLEIRRDPVAVRAPAE